MSRFDFQRFQERSDRRPEAEPRPDRLVWDPLVLPPETDGREVLEERVGKRIRGWVVLAMFVTTIVIAYSWRTSIHAFLASMNDIGAAGRTLEERTVGLTAFGICGVLIVAIVRILKR